MRALLVYESMYGNTAKIGEAIAEALREQGIEMVSGPVSRIGPEAAGEIDLLAVGGPTHVHGMSSAKSRQSAVDDDKNTYAEPTIAPGLREWIADLTPGDGRMAGAFDTRIDKAMFLTGSAAKGIAKRLGRQGFHLVLGPESFQVTTANELVEGELHHATTWGVDLAHAASART